MRCFQVFYPAPLFQEEYTAVPESCLHHQYIAVMFEKQMALE